MRTLTSRIKAIGRSICERDPEAVRIRDARLIEQGGGNAPTVTRQDIVPPLETGLIARSADVANGTLFPQPWIVRDRAYVEGRVRAGVLERGTVRLMEQFGLAGRMHGEGLVHDGTTLSSDGEGFRIDLKDLTGGATVMVYGQQELRTISSRRRTTRDGGDASDACYLRRPGFAASRDALRGAARAG